MIVFSDVFINISLFRFVMLIRVCGVRCIIIGCLLNVLYLHFFNIQSVRSREQRSVHDRELIESLDSRSGDKRCADESSIRKYLEYIYLYLCVGEDAFQARSFEHLCQSDTP